MTSGPLAEEIRQRLGRRRLHRSWAKVEILLGLSAAGAGLLLGTFAVTRPEPEWAFAAGGLGLFVLGGFLALAGHRSHLYQSANEQAALLIEEMRRHAASNEPPPGATEHRNGTNQLPERA